MKKRSWTIGQLKNAVKTSLSYRQVLKQLRLREAGGNYEQLKRYISEFHLDVKHFRGKAWSKGLRGIGKPHIPLEKILTRNSLFQSYKLKMRLFQAKLKPQNCEECGWARHSESGHLPLELDHTNGDRHDNRIENLRILCPNCHSLKSTHRGKNIHKNFARVEERQTRNT